jgi:hypothetical protein
MTHLENMFRKELSPMEEAVSTNKIYMACSKSYADTATIIGITPQAVAARVSIIKGLSPKWTKEFAKKKSDYTPTVAHLEILASFDETIQSLIYTEGSYYRFNNLSDFKKSCLNYRFNLTNVHWDLTSKLGKLMTCDKCKTRTDHKTDLFGVVTKGQLGDCLNKKCWDAKMKMFTKTLIKESKEKHPKLRFGIDGYLGYYEKQEFKEEHGSAIEISDTEKAKQTDKTAFPLLILAGKRFGKIMWRKFAKQASSNATQGTGPTSLKDRRDKLMRKRWSMVNATLVQLLKKDWDVTQLKYADKVTAVMYLVSCFGIKTFKASKFTDIEKMLDGKLIQKAMTDKLFEQVQECFLYDIKWNGPVTQMGDSMIALTKLVAKIFQIDLKPYIEESELKFKEPKSWADLKADGTPKVKK